MLNVSSRGICDNIDTPSSIWLSYRIELLPENRKTEIFVFQYSQSMIYILNFLLKTVICVIKVTINVKDDT